MTSGLADALPAPALMPERIYALPELRYPPRLNVGEQLLDVNADGGRAGRTAVVAGDTTLTYAELHAEVVRMGSALRSLGVGRGDRVAIYLPMIPEAAIAMLACTRIGAIHSVVFGGFSPESLRDRINDSECKLLITADGSYRRGQVIALKRNADVALDELPCFVHCYELNHRVLWSAARSLKLERICNVTGLLSFDRRAIGCGQRVADKRLQNSFFLGGVVMLRNE